MRTNRIILCMALCAATLGCSVEQPVRPRTDDGMMMAEIVSGAIGRPSSGLTAVLDDLIAAGTSGDIAVDGFISEPGSGQAAATLARGRTDAVSDWRRRYVINRDTISNDGAAPGIVTATLNGEQTFRSGGLHIQGESKGSLHLARSADSAGFEVRGEFETGGIGLQTSEEEYRSVSVRISFASLEVTDGTAITGRCDVTVSAGGAHGIVARTGTLTFDGTTNALLVIGGRKYIIDFNQVEIAPLS